MLDINFIRNNPDIVRTKVSLKGVDTKLVDTFLKADKQWRDLISQRDTKKSEQKQASTDKNITKAKTIKTAIQKLDKDIKELEITRADILDKLPNLPDDDVPAGTSDKDNVVVREVGEKPNFKFKPKDHMELGTSLGIINTDQAAKVSGARFSYLIGDAALIEFALVKLAFDIALKEGFVPVVPPVLTKPSTMKGMGKGKFLEEEDAFYLPADDLYLIGSAEHTLGPILMDKTVDASKLPIRFIGFSTAFRREAGSYGKDTKGILRVHQFDKLELFSFTTPEQSRKEHQFLVSIQEKFMKKLKLPYRVVDICTGDMTWGDVRQFDIETWMPSQNVYRETNSCSNTADFQARGINARFKNKQGEVTYLHTLNGTGFAIGRTLIAIMENYQQADGSIVIPSALEAYVGKSIIKPQS